MAVPTAFLPRAAEDAQLQKYRQIDSQLRTYAENGAIQDRAVRLQALYSRKPWLSPGIATAYVKWQEQFGTQAARGLAGAAQQAATTPGASRRSINNQLEDFVATKDFQAQVKAWKDRNSDGQGWFGDIVDNIPVAGAVKGIVEGKDLGEIALRAVPGAKLATTIDKAAFQGAGEIPGVGNTIKGVSRAGFTALESPYQELQAGASSLLAHTAQSFTGAAQSVGSGQAPISNDTSSIAPSLTNPVNPVDSGLHVGPQSPFGTSTGAIALDKLLSGDNVDLGTGFFPGGEVQKQHQQEVRNIASFNYGGQRHFATPGRILASTVTEPGTDPYNVLSGLVDAATILKTDPANIALAKLGDINEARKGFAAASEVQDAGGFTSWVRHFTDAPTVDQYLASRKGTALKQMLANMGPDQLTELGRRTNWKWGADTYASVINATTPEEVDAALRPALGLTIDRQPALKSFAAGVRNVTAQIPYLTEVPGKRIQLDTASLGGQSGSLRALYNHALGLGLDDTTISQHLNDILQSSGRVGRSEGLIKYMQMERAGLIAKGIPEWKATELTRFAKEDLAKSATGYFDKQIATGEHIPGVMIGGEAFPLDKPYLVSEHLGDSVYLTPLYGKGGRNEALAKYGRILGIPGTGIADKTETFTIPAERQVPSGVFAESPFTKAPEAKTITLEAEPGALSKAAHGVQGAAWSSNAFLTHLQNAIWKPLQLIRGAWAVRVLGEEQIRMAMAGYDNIFTHPISYLSFLANKREGQYNDLLDWAAEQGALRNSMEGAFGFNDAWGRVVARMKGTFTPQDYGHADVWANKLAQYSEDPLMQRVARSVADNTHLDDLKQQFWDGSLQGFRKDLATDPNFAQAGIDLTTQEGASHYIDGLYDRLHYYTSGDGDLINAVANQTYRPNLEAIARTSSLKGTQAFYDGEPVEVLAHRKGGKTATVLFSDGTDQKLAVSMLDSPAEGNGVKLLTKNRDGIALDKNFAQHLRSLPDDVKPASVTGVHNVRESAHGDTIVNWAFANLMDKPTSYLNRSTVFVQSYERQMERLQPFIRSGEVTAAEADSVAKGHALDDLRNLLYDTHRRNRALASLQLLAPFGEAWKEMFGSWARIIAERPQTIRKFQIGVTAAQQANPFSFVPGAIPDTYADKGFFFKDPNNNGEEMFVYPWSAAMNEQLVGVPVPFLGQAQSLNIGFNLFPGLGPVVQTPAMWALNRYMNDKKWDPIRHILAPYGEPDLQSGFLENIGLPAWARKWVLAATATPNSNTQNGRALNSLIGDIMSYRATTGEFNPNDPGDFQKAYNQAEKDARWLYVFRGAFQSVAPAAPSPEFLAETKNKNLTQFWLLSKALRDLYKQDPNTAVAKFIDRFGEYAMYATAPKTLGSTFGNEYTPQAWDWQRSNKSLVDKYPLSWAEYVPRNSGDGFSSDAYQQALSRGDTTAIPAKERVRRTNNVLGAMWYDRVRQKLGLKPGEAGTRQQQLYLADVRNEIHKSYPGWRQVLTDDSRVPRVVEELVAASKDRRVKAANPDLYNALNAYVKERAYVLSQVKANGGGGDFTRPGFATGAQWAPYREYLRNVAEQIGKQVPQFNILWQDTFAREMSQD